MHWYTLCEEPTPTNARGRVSGAIWPRKMTGVLGKSRLPRCALDGRVTERGFSFRFRPYPNCTLVSNQRTWWERLFPSALPSNCAELDSGIEIP
jgi:hypothetical protein